MNIKNTAITAKMVIHSLLALLENENVDISSVKFKVGSDGNGYESPEFELEKLVSLAIDGLVGIEEANAVPEGFVLVPKEPTELFKEHLKNHLFDLWAGDHGCDWDGFVSVDAINHNTIWKMMIGAQEQNHEQ